MATSTSTDILNGHTLNTSQWTYAKQSSVNPSGGKNLGIRNAATNKKLYVSSPIMMTWGVNEWTNDGIGKNSYDMSLAFPRETDVTDATEKFLSGLIEMENTIKQDAQDNCKEWFNKSKMSSDVVEALWSPMLKYPKHPDTNEPDTDRPPTLKLKLPFWEDKFNCELYDINKKMLFPNDSDTTPHTLIQKGSNIAAVIECGGIWFANGKFGVTWRLVQATLLPRTGIRGTCHIELDATTMKNYLTSTDEEESNKQETDVEVVDSDDEDDDESLIEKETTHVVEHIEGGSQVAEEVVEEVAEEVAAEVAPKKVKKVVKRSRKKDAEIEH